MSASQSRERRASGIGFIAAILLGAFFASFGATAAQARPEASEFRLKNGLHVVVVPDHRLPLASHGIWYKVGASDDPEGKGGLAHFLEHLMFKGTAKHPAGSFNALLDSVGGQQNASTDADVTSYYQFLPKSRLELVMEMEADRMRGLQIDEDEVATERNVVLEERKMRVDDNPMAGLQEKLRKAFYAGHPYQNVAIGEPHEITSYSRKDALAFYERWYMPSNALVVIVGDVTVEEARTLAEKTYGRVPGGGSAPERKALQPLPPITTHEAAAEHERSTRPSLLRLYRAPGFTDGNPDEAAALLMLAQVLGSETGRLYTELVIEKKLASGVSASHARSLQGGTLSLGAVATATASAEQVEAAIDEIVAEVKQGGVTAEELEIERNSYLGGYVVATDSQNTLMRWYGSWMSNGASLEEVEGWIERLEKVTVEDVNRVARKYLDSNAAVTGVLSPAKGTHGGHAPGAPHSAPHAPH